jgi:hypothetical protein
MSIINPGDTPIDPQVVDGTELAHRLNRLYSAVHSSHSNPSRPPSITAGGVWSRTVTGGHELMFYDGTADHKIGSSVGGVASFGGGGGDKFASDFVTSSTYKTGDIIWNAALGQFEKANKDIAAGSAKAPGDWVATPDLLSNIQSSVVSLAALSAAVHSMFRSATRPTALTVGGIWTRPVPTGFEILVFDGTNDLQIGTVLAGVFRVSTQAVYGCRAWVNFNGTGSVAIRASANVSSITDNGTGDYTVNLTTALTDANYCVVPTVSDDVAGGSNSRIHASIRTQTASSVRYSCNGIGTSSFFDTIYNGLIFVR